MNTYFRRGDHVAGRAIAEGLIRDYRATIHEKNALLSLFYADMTRKRTAQAQDALASLLRRFAADEDVQAALWLAEVEGLSVQGFGKSTDFVTDTDPIDSASLDVFVYPNPLNPVASIGYRLDRESPVGLSVFDILGREVVRLVDAVQPSGRHEAIFDGSALSTGVYIYRLSVGDVVQSGSLVLLK